MVAELSVIIVSYNVRYFLEQALLAVRKASVGLGVEVIVVDNQSTDHSVRMVKEKFPEVWLLESAQNLGFSKANNLGIKQAQSEYILLLNPDTLVAQDTFAQCLDFMRSHPQAGAVGIRMIDGAGQYLPESKRGFPSPLVAFFKTAGLSSLFPQSRIFNRYYLGHLDPEQSHEVDVLCGAFMLMPKKVLEKVGLLDEAFFMYGEDIDLSYRIVKAGYRVYYYPGTTMLHYKGESSKKGSLQYVKIFYQAMIIFTKKHFSGRGTWVFTSLLQAAIYFRGVVSLVSGLVKINMVKWPRKVAPAYTVVVGSGANYTLVKELMHTGRPTTRVAGRVAISAEDTSSDCICLVTQLPEILDQQPINEIIFCAADVTHADIMDWMQRLAGRANFMIMPEGARFIIGSRDKNAMGEVWVGE